MTKHPKQIKYSKWFVCMSSRYVMWRPIPLNANGKRQETANWFW